MRIPALKTDVRIPALLSEFTVTIEAIVFLAHIIVTALLCLRCYYASWPLLGQDGQVLPVRRLLVRGSVHDCPAVASLVLTSRNLQSACTCVSTCRFTCICVYVVRLSYVTGIVV